MLRARLKPKHSAIHPEMEKHEKMRAQLVYSSESMQKVVNINKMDKNHIINSLKKLSRHGKSDGKMYSYLLNEINYRHIHKIEN
tara:strand:- start:1098 stop:1349 length:252 start_codon:yes stop_codon:yes gene_type:complete